jgi:UDP-N-acetylglucosamine 2-epimerase (non-hydrolysing)
MKSLKVMTIVGTRPEIIRLSRVMAALDSATEHVLVHTGQNYDYELNQVFFDDLGVSRPKHFLEVDTTSLGAVLGNTLIGAERVLNEEKPDSVLILGDTNSAIAGIMARRMKVPVYHMEAGNRCFDFNVPEELNRRIIDHVADFNLVYTEHARRHLLSEGLPHRRIYLTGSPMREVLDFYAEAIDASPILETLGLQAGGYALVSMHREENVDNARNLRALLTALEQVGRQFKVPVVVSTHPRTRKRLEALEGWEPGDGIRFLKPFGFHDYNKLQKHAFCVLSDSGTISEESALLGFPAVTIRNAIERPEALDTGSIILTGVEPDSVVRAVGLVTAENPTGERPPVPVDYQVRNTSQRVVNLIVGTAGLSNQWAGIVRHDQV